MEYLDKLNPEQKEMVTTVDGPVFVVAGAGSGKTQSMISRLAYMIDNGINPKSILLLTFTNKAADEMKERAVRFVGDKASDITACTYHSFCVQMLRKYAGYAGLNRDFTVISTSDVESALSLIKTEFEYNKIKGFPNSKQISGWISSSINNDLSFEDILKDTKYSIYSYEISKISERYVEYKKEHGYIDYDDMLTIFLQALQNPELASKVANTYQYIMCDETQDENNIQTNIVTMLRSNNKNILIVGDDQQSIYQFRGANVRNFLSFPTRFPDCKKITLFRNYRSTQEILDLANVSLREHAKEGIIKEMRSDKSSGEKPFLVNVRSQQEEASFILNKIKSMRANGHNYSDIAVLSRMSNQSLTLEALLSQSNIPYVKYGGIKFLERKDVVAILSYLRVIANPTDELAWYNVLQNYEGIGKTYSEKLSKLASDKKYDLLLEHPYKKHKFAKFLTTLHSSFMSWRDYDLKSLVTVIIEHFIENKRKTALDANNEDKLIPAINREYDEEKKELSSLIYISENFKNLFDFLDSFVLDMSREEEDSDAVVISTIHSAKGLEWDTVFLLDVVDGYCPVTNTKGEATNEELRCFYVAITRPKNHLYLMRPAYVVRFGNCEAGVPSRYLDGCEDYYTSIYGDTQTISA